MAVIQEIKGENIFKSKRMYEYSNPKNRKFYK